MVVSELQAGLQALTGLRTIAGGLVGVRDLAMLGDIKTDLQAKIIDAQAAMMALQASMSAQRDEIESLKTELAQIKRQASDRERYVLHSLTAGAFVYRLRDGMEPPEPTHYLCQTCFDKGTKSVLQREDKPGVGVFETCSICKNHIKVGNSAHLGFA